MHKSWQEQIPFYVAGQLSPEERAALDRHLSSCEDCREAVWIWSLVASAVREDSAARVGYVPPLQVEIQSRNGHYKEPIMTTSAHATPLRPALKARQPIMAVAAVLITLLLGIVLLIFAAQSLAPGPQYGNKASVSVLITPTPIPTATPFFLEDPSLPEQYQLEGIRSEMQTWNNSGPATLSMALSYYGWEGDQYEAARWLRPNTEDKSAAPWQMVYFVNQFTDYKALYRMGGTVTLLKQLIAAGFPVIVQIGFQGTGVQPEDEDWMGHHLLLTGYNMERQFLAFDSYLGSNEDQGRPQPYDYVDDNWRQFNRTFIVIYEPLREDELRRALGNYVDPAFGAQTALEFARVEATLDREDRWAWFNMGTSYTALGEYENAAAAYDRALRLALPWRMFWYQFGPYEAYFKVGRYEDVVSLTESMRGITTYIEETYYWQGMAYAALGQTDQAIASLNQALQYNSNFFPAEEAIAAVEAGETPEFNPATD